MFLNTSFISAIAHPAGSLLWERPATATHAGPGIWFTDGTTRSINFFAKKLEISALYSGVTIGLGIFRG